MTLDLLKLSIWYPWSLDRNNGDPVVNFLISRYHWTQSWLVTAYCTGWDSKCPGLGWYFPPSYWWDHTEYCHQRYNVSWNGLSAAEMWRFYQWQAEKGEVEMGVNLPRWPCVMCDGVVYPGVPWERWGNDQVNMLCTLTPNRELLYEEDTFTLWSSVNIR